MRLFSKMKGLSTKMTYLNLLIRCNVLIVSKIKQY